MEPIPKELADRAERLARQMMAELEEMGREIEKHIPENQRKPFTRVIGDTIMMIGDHLLYPIIDMYPELNATNLPERNGFVRIWGPRSKPNLEHK